MSVMEKKIKFKFDWYSLFDKIEKWLEDIEVKGYNLYKINKFGGIFYFYKGSLRKIKYIVDYYYDVENNYFDEYKLNGWNFVFRSIGSFMGIFVWYIWLKEYKDIFFKLYSDFDKINKVKLILFMNMFIFFMLVVIFIYLLNIEIRNLYSGYGVFVIVIVL